MKNLSNNDLKEINGGRSTTPAIGSVIIFSNNNGPIIGDPAPPADPVVAAAMPAKFGYFG